MNSFVIGSAPYYTQTRKFSKPSGFGSSTESQWRTYTVFDNPLVFGLFGKTLDEANTTCGLSQDVQREIEKIENYPLLEGETRSIKKIVLSGWDRKFFDLGSTLRSIGLSIKDFAILVSSKLSSPKTLGDFNVKMYVSPGLEHLFITDTVKSRLEWLEEFSQRKSDEIDAQRKRALRTCAIGCEDEVWLELTQHLETLSQDEMTRFFAGTLVYWDV